MPDLSKMSEQELMTMAGQSSQASGAMDMQSMSDAELYKLASGGQTPSFFDNSEAQASELSGSPLNLGDRLKLSFADDTGREKYLKETKGYKFVQKLENGKYAVGNDPRNLQPIDPSGMFNDVIGDAADIVGEIPVIAGQIAGSMAGTAAEPGLGTIVGGGVGAGLGEMAKKTVGSFMGVNKESAEKQAADIAISGALGSAGEGAMMAINKLGGSVIRPGVSKLFDGLNKTSKVSEGAVDPITGAILDNEPGRFAKTMSKLFKITAGIDERSTLTAFKHGVADTLSPENLNNRTVLPIVSSIKSSINTATENLGNSVRRESAKLAKAAAGMDIEVGDLVMKLKQDLLDNQIIDDVGRPIGGKFREVEKSFFSDLLKKIDNPQIIVDANGSPVSSSVKSIKLPEALKLKSFIEDSYDVLDDRSAKIAKDFLKGDEFSKTKGLRLRLREAAADPRINQPGYINANNKFSKFKDLKDRLRRLDTKNPADAEKFVKSLERQAEFTMDDLKLLQAETPHIPFLKRAEMWNAAQDFKGANPNLLRVGAVLGLTGMGNDNTLQGKASRFGVGVALTTPAGIRMLMRGGSKLASSSTALKAAANSVSRPVVNRSSAALLSGLLRNKSQRR